MVTFVRQNQDILGLIILLGGALTATVLLHWIVVCPRLYRKGARFPTGLLFWRVFAELRRYRDLTSALGKPLTFYYTNFILTWFTLLLALSLAVRILWLQTHVGAYY
jgi:hypothetical protein